MIGPGQEAEGDGEGGPGLDLDPELGEGVAGVPDLDPGQDPLTTEAEWGEKEE